MFTSANLQILDVFNISISSLTGQLDTALDGIDLTGIIPRDTIDQLTANLPNVSAFVFSSENDTLRTSIMDANSSLTSAQMNVTTLRENATSANAVRNVYLFLYMCNYNTYDVQYCE